MPQKHAAGSSLYSCVTSISNSLGQFLPVTKEAPGVAVVGDAVQDIRTGPAHYHGKNPGQVEPAPHPAIGGVDDGDSVGGPDVCPDVAFYLFQLVQAGDRQLAVPDFHAATLVETSGIEKTQLGGAVTHHKFIAQGCQAPALARIAELADGIQGDRVAAR